MMHSTELLYADSLLKTYLFSFEGACLLALNVEPDGKHVSVVLDKTIFHPQGGGQPSDIGTLRLMSPESADPSPDDGLSTLTVAGMKEYRSLNQTWHLVGVPAKYASAQEYVEALKNAGWKPRSVDPDSESPSAGAELEGPKVSMEIDPAFRLLCGRLHSAAHAMDSAIKKLNWPWTPCKAFCFPEGPYMELTADDKSDWFHDFMNPTDVQSTNKFGGPNAKPTAKDLAAHRTKQYERLREELEQMVVALLHEHQGNQTTVSWTEGVRMIGMLGEESPCGGTHMMTMEEVGPVTITKVGLKKNVFKVQYDVSRDFHHENTTKYQLEAAAVFGSSKP